jgi:hypothetical protein
MFRIQSVSGPHAEQMTASWVWVSYLKTMAAVECSWPENRQGETTWLPPKPEERFRTLASWMRYGRTSHRHHLRNGTSGGTVDTSLTSASSRSPADKTSSSGRRTLAAAWMTAPNLSTSCG